MSSSKSQPWDFGAAAEEEKPKPDLPRDTLVQKTRVAARKVGYGNSSTNAEAAVEKREVDSNKNKAPATGRPRGNRTKALATKITPEQEALVKAIAGDGMVIADIVSEAMKALAREVTATGRYKRLHLDAQTVELAKSVLSAPDK